MIRLFSSQQYDLHSSRDGSVLIDAPESPLDGSIWPGKDEAEAAIEKERRRLQTIIEKDLHQGGPLQQGLALFALQLQELGWEDLDIDIDLTARIVVFPSDEMLSIRSAHDFLQNLIDEGVQDDPYAYGEHLDEYQRAIFEQAIS